MRFQLLAARSALGALILAVIGAVVAVAGVRLGFFPYATGMVVMWPATGLGLLALAAAIAWLWSAIAKNEGAGKRIGLIALLGSLVFLYPPLSTVWAGSPKCRSTMPAPIPTIRRCSSPWPRCVSRA